MTSLGASGTRSIQDLGGFGISAVVTYSMACGWEQTLIGSQMLSIHVRVLPD